ncbi:type II toxin-antitoxin system PemK/MazF family toxin [Psychroflexus sp. CAK57W]|uniref:type II toxin-antitoxin system PemK/MazF family toxin n=1 Tax=Psychroflexus curvus TaxID=2873595 RepID=UPI001CC97121|nr:type II toxin-antitoxin system PemK/MazF family toxin [Psychroflexus curvus]MBZ9787861.1 type II toxin-antitoxin system PemK/MazF family toxin [Psychroflexus curvus]
MKKGDIVLIPFPFTDLSGTKNRPAIVLISTDEDVTICFMTTQLKWKSKFDVRIKPSEVNGLKKESLIRLNKMATVNKDLVIGLLGHLEEKEVRNLNQSLISILKLDPAIQM